MVGTRKQLNEEQVGKRLGNCLVKTALSLGNGATLGYTSHNTVIAELLTMKMTICHYFIRIGCAVMLLVSGSSAYADSSTHTGKGTFYDYTGGGNCSLPVSTTTLTAAMNASDYANSAACGGFIKITNNDTGLSVTVRVDDQCPECAPGNVDLDQDAFAQIANLATGIIPISWQYVANAQAGNLKLYFEGSSSQWWTAVQVRDTAIRLQNWKLASPVLAMPTRAWRGNHTITLLRPAAWVAGLTIFGLRIYGVKPLKSRRFS